MRINVGGKNICELEPIEATQKLTEDELFWYCDHCFSLSSPFQPVKEWYESFVEHGTNLLFMIMEGYL